jgi:hypothetical protein
MTNLRNCLIGFSSVCLIAVVAAGAACRSDSQPANSGAATTGATTTSKVDLSTPEGPIRVIFTAAQEKNYELYRRAFAETINPRFLSEQRFSRFARRVQDKTIEPTGEVEKISETEAIVKLKSKKRDLEREVRVKKFGDRWLIVEFMR